MYKDELVYTYIYIHVNWYIHTYIYMYKDELVYTYIRICMYKKDDWYIHIYTHVYKDELVYTYIYTHVQG